jgi:hypothetical protein
MPGMLRRFARVARFLLRVPYTYNRLRRAEFQTVRELNGCRRVNGSVARCPLYVHCQCQVLDQHIQPACWVNNPEVDLV